MAMNYHFYHQRRDPSETLSMTERHSGTKVAYYSKGKMQELYPEGGYEIIGEISNLAKRYAVQDVVVSITGKLIPIFPRGTLRKPFEWVVGYAAVGPHTYVCVVKGVIPHYRRNEQ